MWGNRDRGPGTRDQGTGSHVVLLALAVAGLVSPLPAQQPDDVSRLIGALLGDTPMIRDLQQLTDEVGGRATGSAANLKGVTWALARFKQAGVPATREAFPVPSLWLERSATATVRGPGIEFSPRVAAMPYSVATSPAGRRAPLVDAGHGTEADFKALGEKAKLAWVLVEMEELKDI